MPAGRLAPYYRLTERSTRDDLTVRNLEARMFRPEIRLAHVSTGLVKAPREVFDFCLVYFFSSSGICRINGVDHPFTPRTVLVEPPFRPSHFELEPAMSTQHVAVHFDMCEGFPDRSPIHLRQPYRVQFSRELEVPVSTAFPASYPLSELLVQLVEAWQRQDLVGRLRANANLSQVLLDACRFSRADRRAAGPTRIHRSVALAARFIEHHFAEPIGPGQVADAVGYSANYLCRMFRNETGSSLMEFLTLTRMRRAAALLEDPRHSVKDVARLTGYQNARHFSRTFRECRGMTPTQWREAKGSSATS